MSKTSNIVLVGIGGQGTLTLMEMLAMAAEEAGEEVRVLSRVSLARLGGSGMCHIRIGPAVSAAIPVGEADVLLVLEMSEVLRALPMARRGSLAFTDDSRQDQDDARINIIMLGVLCGYTQLLPRTTLEQSIAQRLPRFAEQNLRTFAAGWSFGEAQRR